MKTSVFITLVVLAISAKASQLPFSETFDALTPGSVDGQNGWVLDNGTNATIQSSIVATNSTQALEIQNSQITHSLSNAESSVWISFQARITAVPDTNPAVTNTNTSVAFFVNTNGNLVVYNGTVPIELTSAPMPINQWVRFDVYCDYSNLKWMLSVNGTNVTNNLALYSASAQIESLLIANNSTNAVYFDELAIQDTEPASGLSDTDGDSIPDWWEQKYFNSITGCSPTNSTGNDGLTCLQAYIAGVNPDVLDPFEALKAPNGRGLRWVAKPGRSYDIEWTPDLMTAFSNVATVSWRDAAEFIDDTNTNAPSGFYRLKARLE